MIQKLTGIRTILAENQSSLALFNSILTLVDCYTALTGWQQDCPWGKRHGLQYGWHHPFVIGWSKYRLGLLSALLHYGLAWLVGILTVFHMPVTHLPFAQPLRQAGLPLGLYKGTVKASMTLGTKHVISTMYFLSMLLGVSTGWRQVKICFEKQRGDSQQRQKTHSKGLLNKGLSKFLSLGQLIAAQWHPPYVVKVFLVQHRFMWCIVIIQCQAITWNNAYLLYNWCKMLY